MYQAAHEADKDIIAFSPLAQMALKWVLKDHVVTSVLIGASKPSQILDNLKVLESADFTEEELKRIDQASKMENKKIKRF